jgi:class 3 adenylate cyclase
MAMGDIQLLSLRPFSRTHLGAVGDTINMAARLSSHAKPGQITVSNTVFRSLAPQTRALLSRADPVEAKNVGRIQAWTYDRETIHAE